MRPWLSEDRANWAGKASANLGLRLQAASRAKPSHWRVAPYGEPTHYHWQLGNPG